MPKSASLDHCAPPPIYYAYRTSKTFLCLTLSATHPGPQVSPDSSLDLFKLSFWMTNAYSTHAKEHLLAFSFPHLPDIFTSSLPRSKAENSSRVSLTHCPRDCSLPNLPSTNPSGHFSPFQGIQTDPGYCTSPSITKRTPFFFKPNSKIKSFTGKKTWKATCNNKEKHKLCNRDICI